MDDIFCVGDEGGRPSTHACERGGVDAQLEHGFLDAIALGFLCFGDALPSFVVGRVAW